MTRLGQDPLQDLFSAGLSARTPAGAAQLAGLHTAALQQLQTRGLQGGQAVQQALQQHADLKQLR